MPPPARSAARSDCTSIERNGHPAADTFAFGAATVDASTLTVTASDGTSQRLLPRELKLLKLFAENPGKVFSRDELLDRFWGVSYYGTTRTLDQRLMLLRKKLGSDAARIESVHGVGYRFAPDPA